MPHGGYSALHGVNPHLKKIKEYYVIQTLVLQFIFSRFKTSSFSDSEEER